MRAPDRGLSLDEQIEEWRSHLRRRRAIHSADVAELEDHLREQIDVLRDSGLSADEAFLVAVKRIGSLDALSQEFGREHADRLWKQLVAPAGSERSRSRTDAIVAICLAAAAALLIRVPKLFGIELDGDAPGFYGRNISLMVLPLLTAYFVWKRRIDSTRWPLLAAPFLIGAVFANVYPFARGSWTEALTALHLPIALWLIVGIAYAGARWNEVAGRMDFIRFSGELLIYYGLIALCGFVFTGFTALIFSAARVGTEPIFETLLPSAAVAAVMIASWLVEAKQSVVENMAPVLTRLFTPLFTAALLAFLVTLAWTGRGLHVDRAVLIGFDVLLLMVLGLLLYSVSARDPQSPPGAFDALQVVLLISALIADAVALWAMSARIAEFGFTANRAAALGQNVILLVNLAWSAALYIRFLRRRGSFATLERWQTSYLPVYAAWAAIVAIVFPPLFGYD